MAYKYLDPNCPCYTCLVAAACPGKEPSPEEHDRIMEEIKEDEKKNGYQYFSPPVDDDIYDDYECPVTEAQNNCPVYKEWLGLDKDPDELFINYIGIDFPQIKVIGEKGN